MTIQVLHTVTWQDKSSHLFVAFCWVQFLEITSRHINHCADSIDLIMQACVNDSKEIVTLSLIRSNFTLPLVEQVTFNKVSYLVDLGLRPRYSHRYYHVARSAKVFSKHRSTGPCGCVHQ
ncbi:Uncharacterised protein [Streptococcus pneumoniae]|nr:Uncharacterised protein [Streptococcus pneumoniae]